MEDVDHVLFTSLVYFSAEKTFNLNEDDEHFDLKITDSMRLIFKSVRDVTILYSIPIPDSKL